jgi:hypothetical protein
MGLDTSHDCWHGAYSAFSRWRNKIAEVAGYMVAEINYGGVARETVMIDWGHITAANLAGYWDKTPDDPLLVLIAHSDCDGKIYPEQAGPLADRLQSLLPKLPDEKDPGHIGYWKQKTEQFIRGLRNAVAENEPVEFH